MRGGKAGGGWCGWRISTRRASLPGSADEILRALERYALTWDGEVVFQSQRIALYEAALNELRAKNRVFDCACSRADLQRAASAPLGEEPLYPGTCRDGIAAGRVPRAVRFRGRRTNGRTTSSLSAPTASSRISSRSSSMTPRRA